MSDPQITPNHFVFLCGAHMDQIMRLHAPSIQGVSNPANIESYPGGAALNSASIAAALGLDASLVSPIGSDLNGNNLVTVCEDRGVRPCLIATNSNPTGLYSAIFEPNGDILIGASDLGIYNIVDPNWIDAHLPKCKGLFLSSNLSEPVLIEAVQRANFVSAATISPAKASRLKSILGKINLLFTNKGEAGVLSGITSDNRKNQAQWFIDHGVQSGTISDGANDLLYWDQGEIFFLKTLPVSKIVDVNGAGDALAGGVLAGLGRGYDFEESIKLGAAAAAFSLSHSGPYSPELNLDILKANL